MATDTSLFLERPEEAAELAAAASPFGTDDDLLATWKTCKKESFDNRWIWERGWMRNIHYVNNRHWIEYVRRTNEWRDVRLAKWFPKPVTPSIAVGVQALRAMFAAVDIGVNVRPNGAHPDSVAVASFADEYSPVLHEEHQCEQWLDEHDFWFIVCGNAFIHTYLERDAKHGFEEITSEQCISCATVVESHEIADAGQVCPQCGATEFVPAVDAITGEPVPPRKRAKGKGITAVLSPFEMAFPSSYARFDDVPYVIRIRWRNKEYYENHPTLKTQVAGFTWAKAPTETSMQLFRSLPYHNDMGVAPFLGNQSGGSETELGAAEYEVNYRPCDKYPEGLVFRVLGDANPRILHMEEDEAIPGVLPYQDSDGTPIFTFEHSGFEQRGGRVWATSPLDAAIQKQNTLNQHDAFGLMVVNRMANPLWLVPKGAEIEKFTGEPGHVVRWNPLTVGGNAKPERVDGVGLGGWFFQLRDSYMSDLEEALGTSDVLKGSKPAGVEAFAALQLLVERGQSRFASAFKARGRLYKSWFKFALEIEREFGPDERTKWVMSPARSWTRKIFKRANLQNSFSIVVEEGSQTPKTALGQRAAIQHLHSLGMVDVTDPDQKYAVLKAFGQTKLVPSLDIHVQAALRKQQEFEEWASDPVAQQEAIAKSEQDLAAYEQTLATVPPPTPVEPQVDPVSGMAMPVDPMAEQQALEAQIPPPPSMNANTPLAWKPWYKPEVHKQEFMKWANGDSVVELLKTNPGLEPLLVTHLEEIEVALQEQLALMAGPQPTPPQGAGMAMKNSNQEAGGLQPGV